MKWNKKIQQTSHLQSFRFSYEIDEYQINFQFLIKKMIALYKLLTLNDERCKTICLTNAFIEKGLPTKRFHTHKLVNDFRLHAKEQRRKFF